MPNIVENISILKFRFSHPKTHFIQRVRSYKIFHTIFSLRHKANNSNFRGMFRSQKPANHQKLPSEIPMFPCVYIRLKKMCFNDAQEYGNA